MRFRRKQEQEQPAMQAHQAQRDSDAAAAIAPSSPARPRRPLVAFYRASKRERFRQRSSIPAGASMTV
jgi:hypothetical protein